ncbi:hypothetical protein VME0621_01582 [Vibrio mediterranei]|uniref:hypothetical protein n=1 Tax=Vibrio mediterranei TaxID=689 RepID=UPI000784EAED|nr:hypothetical protein [Vibrio mediterranei]SBO09483.1 hypothetical protein VME0621_01582 [Vibrio mediterranei]
MGGSSSSRNSTSTKNTSSQNAISGDNLGVALSGIEGSTINATVTDHGSVGKSFDFAGDALDESYEFAKGAMSESLNLVDQNTENSMKFASGALDKFSSSNSENLQMIAGLAGNQAAQNTKNLDKLTELSKFKQDNGQSALNKQQLILMAIIVLVLGFVLFKAVNK